MADSFPQVGFELVAEGLNNFENVLEAANSAIDDFGNSMEEVTERVNFAMSELEDNVENLSYAMEEALARLGGSTSNMGNETSRNFGKVSTSSVAMGTAMGMVFVEIGKLAVNMAATLIKATTQIAGALINVATNAFDVTASYERLALSMEALIAKELVAEGTTSSLVKVGERRLELTDEQRRKLDDLVDSEKILRATIEGQEESLKKLADTVGTSDRNYVSLQATLNKSHRRLADMNAEINKLSGAEGELVDITAKVVNRTVSMEDAMANAGPRAKELLEWIQKLAIVSPFSQDDVAVALRTAMAYNFTSEEAKDLTEQLIDFSAATGASGAVMNQASLALGQMNAVGKVTKQDLNQLINAGVGVVGILDEMGYTLDDVSAGTVSADDFIKQFGITMERDFGGAAERQAGTLSGLVESIEDLKSVGLRTLFTGIFEPIKPLVSGFVDILTDPKFMETLNTIGNTIGSQIGGALTLVSKIANRVSSLFGKFKLGNIFGSFALPDLATKSLDLLSSLGIDPASISMVENSINKISNIAGTILDMIDPLRGMDLSLEDILKAPELPKAPKITDLLSLFGFSKEGLQKMQANFEKLFEVLGQSFKKVAKLANKSLAPIGEAFSRIFRTILGIAPDVQTSAVDTIITIIDALTDLAINAIPVVTSALTDFSMWFEENGPLIITIASDFFTIIGMSWTIVATVIKTVTQVLAGLVQIITNLFGLGYDVFTKDWEGAWQSILGITEGTIQAIQPLFEGFASIVATLFGSSLDEIAVTLAQIKVLFTLWSTEVQNTWKQNWENFKIIFAFFGLELLEGFFNFFEELTTIWSDNWENFKIIFAFFGLELLKGVETLWKDVKVFVIQGILNILDAIIPFAQNFTEIGWGLIKGLAEGIIAGGTEVIAAISGIGETAVGTLKDILGIASPSRVFAGLGENTMEGLGEGLSSGATGTSDQIASAINQMTITAYEGMAIVGQAVVQGFLQGLNAAGISPKEQLLLLFAGLGEAIMLNFQILIEQWTTSWEMLLVIGNEALSNLVEIFTINFTLVSDWLMEWFASTEFWLLEKKEAFYNIAMAWVMAMIDAFFEQAQLLSETVATVLGETITIALTFVPGFYSAGQRLMEGMKEGVKSKIQPMIDEVVQGIRDAIAAAKAELGVASPSKVFEGIGEALPEGMAMGISARRSEPVAAMSRVIDNVITPAQITGGRGGGGNIDNSFNVQMSNTFSPQSPTKIAEDLSLMAAMRSI